jgi:hypothetical protein
MKEGVYRPLSERIREERHPTHAPPRRISADEWRNLSRIKWAGG